MKTEDILPYKNLHDLYVNQKLSDAQIAKNFGLTLGQVHRLRNKYFIKAIEQHERHKKRSLDLIEVNLIVGLLLGDGHLRLRSGNNTYPSLMIEQSAKHKEYIFKLYEMLSDWLPADTGPPRQCRHEGKNEKVYHSYAFSTVQHPAFFPIYHAFYADGKKKFNNREFIKDNFNVLSLAVWIMDDGSLSGNCRRNMLATNSFTQDEVNFLREMLLEKFGLKTWICKRTNTSEITYEIAFDKKSSNVLSTLLRDLVVPSMQYKLVPPETTNDTDSKDLKV